MTILLPIYPSHALYRENFEWQDFKRAELLTSLVIQQHCMHACMLQTDISPGNLPTAMIGFKDGHASQLPFWPLGQPQRHTVLAASKHEGFCTSCVDRHNGLDVSGNRRGAQAS